MVVIDNSEYMYSSAHIHVQPPIKLQHSYLFDIRSSIFIKIKVALRWKSETIQRQR